MGKELRAHPYHVDVVRNSLTRNIAAKFADVKDEIECSFGDEIPIKDGACLAYFLSYSILESYT